MELVDQLVEQLGISSDQAQGGIGILLGLAREKMGAENFSQLTDAVPDLAGMEESVPPAASSSSLGGLAASIGGGLGKLGQIGRLSEMFSSIDLKGDMVGRFLPIVLSFVQAKGGDTAKQLLAGVLK